MSSCLRFFEIFPAIIHLFKDAWTASQLLTLVE